MKEKVYIHSSPETFRAIREAPGLSGGRTNGGNVRGAFIMLFTGRDGHTSQVNRLKVDRLNDFDGLQGTGVVFRCLGPGRGMIRVDR